MNNENYENEIIDEVYKMILIRYPKNENFFREKHFYPLQRALLGVFDRQKRKKVL